MVERRRSCRCFDGVPANMSTPLADESKEAATNRWVESLVASMEYQAIRGIVRVHHDGCRHSRSMISLQNQDTTRTTKKQQDAPTKPKASGNDTEYW